MIIVPHIDKYENVPNTRLRNTFLHGKLQDEVGYDHFGFKNQSEEFSLEEGKHILYFKGKECTFFYWVYNSFRNKKHGLVVYSDDLEGYTDAENKFNNKYDII